MSHTINSSYHGDHCLLRSINMGTRQPTNLEYDVLTTIQLVNTTQALPVCKPSLESFHPHALQSLS